MRRRRLFVPIALSVGLLLMSGCTIITSSPSVTTAPSEMTGEGVELAALELTSEAFSSQETIPQRFTCDGEDISPPLSWSAPSESARSFALIMDDPDAPMGTWVHWVLFNIPGDKRALPESVPAQDQLSDCSLHGSNSWRRSDYGGPCPPSGSTHRYVFKLYALDSPLDLEAGATKKQVLDAMDGHVLAHGELVGTYSR
jgi:Raf kinase inhibitor-like YbhB/YbcL family protein